MKFNMPMFVACLFFGMADVACSAETTRDDVTRVAAVIDEHLAAQWKQERVTPAPIADDAEFLRRVHLDIAGKIPTVSEVRAFLADNSPDKRRRVVDRLLESPAYITNFANKWRSALMPEADSDIQVRLLVPGFEAWLREKLREDARYDDMVREILTFSFETPDEGGRNVYVAATGTASPVAFYQAKQIAPESLAAATARMFLGVRIECAQCHDHPFDDWKQEEFWSFAAFFAGIERRNPEQGVFGGVRELPDRREIAVPDTDKVVQAAFLDDSPPRFRFRQGPRTTLAEWVASADNPYFTRTAANRLWGHFFGIGLVDPIDDFGPHNAASHPEILDALAKELAAAEFDMKFLIRAITASDAYQRTSMKTDESQSDPRRFARMAVRGMTPEQLYDSLLRATGRHEPFSPQRGFAIGVGDPRSEFLELFANDSDAPTETQTTILQALAMMNGRLVAGATNVEQSKTLAAVLDYPLLDTEGRIETLFLATLSRPPRAEELSRLAEYVEKSSDDDQRRQALADVFWMLLNSSEFLFNH
ncbi:MAG: DUF1549 and DUF1553 domain-containing protein [Pirellulaceae bacterium]